MLLVVALGGNALYDGVTPDQERTARLQRTAGELADLIDAGHRIVVTHGNGPQVGERLLDREARMATGTGDPALPLDVLVALTQAEIGYRLQRALGRELARRGRPTEVVAVVTQVEVDPNDPAFGHPTKPVGPVLGDRPDDGNDYLAVVGGWRRVVASPAPVRLIEVGAITSMVAAGVVPICAGGGGIPVVPDGDALLGVEAVVDKDASSALLASDLDADGLLILTEADAVYRDFGTSQQTALPTLTTDEVTQMLASGQAPTGSMGPKINALARAAAEGRWAGVGALGQALQIVSGGVGTHIEG